jgi:dCMP deaminase
MASQEKLNQTYLAIAQEISNLSRANRAKVGAIIIKDKQIISEGYNGTPTGFDNSCEYYDFLGHYYTKPEVLHAESNAILKLAKTPNSSDGATLYVTLAPCFDCSKLIIQAGIKEVFYINKYRPQEHLRLIMEDGLILLANAGIPTTQIKMEK